MAPKRKPTNSFGDESKANVASLGQNINYFWKKAYVRKISVNAGIHECSKNLINGKSPCPHSSKIPIKFPTGAIDFWNPPRPTLPLQHTIP
jgi:hypothetical protein